MPFAIESIRSQLVGGGARPALFNINITVPGEALASTKLQFMARAGQIPASTLGTIEVGYFGRKIKIAGDRTFAEWTVTVVNDEDFAVRNGMENWMSQINQHEINKRQFSENPGRYKSQGHVQQFGKIGNSIRKYDFVGMWPTEVSTIDLDWNTTDTIEEFTVTFQYDYWQVATQGL
jgi:hypothetical protein